MENKESCRPVPAPRRLYPEVRKFDYENVSVGDINKNLNINSENLHNNTNCNEKVPNNKVFLSNISDEEALNITTCKSILTETNDLYGPNANENVPNVIYSSPTPSPRPRKPQNNATEIYANTGAIYEDIRLEASSPENAIQRNTGAISKDTLNKNNVASTPSSLRKAPELPPKTYLSVDREKQKHHHQQQRAQRHSISSEFLTTSSYRGTGTTTTGGSGNSASYDLSDSNFTNSWTPKSSSNATLNSSIADSNESSENSKYKSPSPGYVDDSDSESATDNDADESFIFVAMDDYPSCSYTTSSNQASCSACNLCNGACSAQSNCKNNIKNMHSAISESATINDLACNDPTACTACEYSDTSSTATTADIELLKSLGTTSKLLTESIGERVALRARGAKHKLDKNLKSSSELLSNLGSETTSRIKNASKRFGTNFTLNKKDAKSKMPEQCEPDRPQTLPPNDKVFSTITFSSPLNQKATGVTDLSTSFDDGTYEVPRNVKPVNTNFAFNQPPSYEDALKCTTEQKFPRNTPVSRSLMVPKHISNEAATVALTKQLSNASLNRLSEEKSGGESSRDSIDSRSLPMPTFPPPALPKEIAERENLYGSLNPIQAPVRLKRRKNYEQIQLRRDIETPSPAGGVSMRANVDSAEIHQLNLEAAAAEREASILIRERNNKAEQHTPKPDRSESWEYMENEIDDDDSERSSPEPLYANQEATYGRVFEMATSNKDLLPPISNTLDSICEESAGACAVNSSKQAGTTAAGGTEPPKDIIREFDPLLSRKSSTICRSSKSNELLLLEHLLEQDTYVNVCIGQTRSDDDVSMCTSEEESLCSASAASQPSEPSTPTLKNEKPKPLTVVIPSPQLNKAPSPPSPKPMQIVHQNAQLLSESMENILEEKEKTAATNAGEERVKPFLARVEEKKPLASEKVDLSRPNQNRSNWFVPDSPGPSNFNSTSRANPFDKLDINDGESPPSYLEAIAADGKQNTPPPEQKSRTARFMNSMNVFSTMKIHVDALKRKTSFKHLQKPSDVKVTLQMVPRPSLSSLLVRYEGPLIRFPSGVVEDILKEMQNRKAILRDRQFQTYLDQEMKTPKETIPLECITTIQCVSNSRVTDNATHFYCFELTTSMPKNGNNSSSIVPTMSNPNLLITSGNSGNCKHQRVAHLYGVGKESERGVWMHKLLESLTNSIPPKYACHYYRAGWCYLKSSITSEWSGTWLVLKKTQRRLIFVSEGAMNVEKMDLRKARCIVLKESDDSIKNLHVESGPTLMIDCPPFTVYLIMSSPRETKIWRHIIREVAHNNGFSLSDQQLTKFNVPVIIDKCINFVYIHGSMSEGIYRKSGSENSILKLMAAFRADAFNVEITRNEYNEHDVANVLKRFMRDLPERLLGKMSESFLCVTEISSKSEKIPIYKELLARLGVIERESLKKIVSHLAFISSQKAKNKMSIQNLTMIWGPTLMQNHNEEMIYSQKEADVLTDLVELYKNLFPLTADEMKKEQEMLMCLQKYYAAAETLTDSVKKSGDLKMWITLNPNPENTTEEKTQINVTITPTITAFEICKELAAKMKMQTHQISLHEVILNDSLERPLHHDTKVFEVVLNWSYWPEEDRKHNYLVVKPIDFLREVQRAVKNLATVTPSKELKFADNRTKSMKSFLCELRDAKIVVSKKDKNDKTTVVREIYLGSTTAYLGCEKKRDFPWSWAITFVERTQKQIMRSRDSPFIGHVLAGSEWTDRTIWFSSIWYCLYGENILPPAEIIIK